MIIWLTCNVHPFLLADSRHLARQCIWLQLKVIWNVLSYLPRMVDCCWHAIKEVKLSYN